MPPTLPEPEAVDQMMFGSAGSGVANPLSPPPIACRLPHAARASAVSAAAAAAAAFAQPAVARSTVGRTILLVRVHVIRDLVVDRHVVQLRVRQPLLQPRPAARLRDRDALIVAD